MSLSTWGKPDPKPEKKEKSKPKGLKRYVKKSTGELEVFIIIWDTRCHYCTNCCGYLGDEMNASFFSHVRPKGMFPQLRLEVFNIELLCFDCHYIWGNRGKGHFRVWKDKNLDQVKNNPDFVHRDIIEQRDRNPIYN